MRALRSVRRTVAAAGLLALFLPGHGSAAADGGPPRQTLHPSIGVRRAPPDETPGPPDAFPDARPRHHDGGLGECADCHVPHAQDGVRRGTVRAVAQPVVTHESGSDPDPLDLCLRCHDGVRGVPDVVGEDVNHLRRRSAGMFATPEQRNPNGHDLGHGLGESDGGVGLCARCHSGNMSVARVTCIDCHDPHGNGRARNLKWASDPDATPPIGLFVDPAATGLDRYEADHVAYGTLDDDQLREASSVCTDCHHTMSGGAHVDPNRDGVFELHPSYDSERGSRNSIRQGAGEGTTDPVHWERGAGSGFGATARVPVVVPGATSYRAARTINAATNGVFCLSCHSAHGSEQAFGLVWTADRGVGPAGCDQCHGRTEVADNTSR